MRVVVDTSVWVSALLSPQSNARLVLDAFLDERFVLLYNRESLIELKDVVTRPKFKGKITTSQWKALFKAIQVFGEPVGITTSFETSDPKDDYLLEYYRSQKSMYDMVRYTHESHDLPPRKTRESRQELPRNLPRKTLSGLIQETLEQRVMPRKSRLLELAGIYDSRERRKRTAAEIAEEARERPEDEAARLDRR